VNQSPPLKREGVAMSIRSSAYSLIHSLNLRPDFRTFSAVSAHLYVGPALNEGLAEAAVRIAEPHLFE
jgi:hypothetical protein